MVIHKRGNHLCSTLELGKNIGEIPSDFSGVIYHIYVLLNLSEINTQWSSSSQQQQTWFTSCVWGCFCESFGLNTSLTKMSSLVRCGDRSQVIKIFFFFHSLYIVNITEVDITFRSNEPFRWAIVVCTVWAFIVSNDNNAI